ncbi:hypothetical protein [Variovorax sp. LjRoot178]|uniref:hypothetical protein n=1 Tax=Variovorax sp. LjRoot178 TaxID=3342277 RepID=UPI003F511116
MRKQHNPARRSRQGQVGFELDPARRDPKRMLFDRFHCGVHHCRPRDEAPTDGGTLTNPLA